MHLDPNDVRAAFQHGPHDFLDVGDCRIAHYRFGDGPPLVFVHGWPLHSATFRDVVAKLAGSFTCHLVDMPGAGHTEVRPDTPIGLRENGETLRKAVDRLGLPRFAYVAHDSGAVFARIAAAGDPRVVGLVLGNTEVPGHRPWLVEAYAKLTKVPGAVALVRRLMRVRAVRTSPLGFGGCLGNPHDVDGEFGDLFVRPLLESKAALEGQMLLLKHLDFGVVDRLAEVHARIQAPTLFVWGADDRFFPQAKAERVLSQFGGGAVLRAIPGARLYANEDHPAEFVEHAEPFLAQCFRRALDTQPKPRAVAQA